MAAESIKWDAGNWGPGALSILTDVCTVKVPSTSGKGISAT